MLVDDSRCPLMAEPDAARSDSRIGHVTGKLRQLKLVPRKKGQRTDVLARNGVCARVLRGQQAQRQVYADPPTFRNRDFNG